MNKLLNINNEEILKLAKKLHRILAYDLVGENRPIDVCDELFNKFKIKYSGVLYHGLVIPYNEEGNLDILLNNYHDWVSCSSELAVAFDFALRNECKNGIILKIELDEIEVLDVSSLICHCFDELPNEKICEEIYLDYAAEHEYLIHCDNLRSHIRSIEFVNVKSEIKDIKFYK